MLRVHRKFVTLKCSLLSHLMVQVAKSLFFLLALSPGCSTLLNLLLIESHFIQQFCCWFIKAITWIVHHIYHLSVIILVSFLHSLHDLQFKVKGNVVILQFWYCLLDVDLYEKLQSKIRTCQTAGAAQQREAVGRLLAASFRRGWISASSSYVWRRV